MSISFGEALKLLRGALKRTSLAPAKHTEQQRRDFASHVGRIEAGKANPGLDTLRVISAGLGYDQLSSFFFAIEAVQRTGRPIDLDDDEERAIVRKWLTVKRAAINRELAKLHRLMDEPDEARQLAGLRQLEDVDVVYFVGHGA